ncbi:MAG: efflux RND transporter permease subunit [Elusimicrobia bacterium]|nr:efflux RND transporter permease subunit [Elusimicrobiota bacterium]
MTLSDISIKNPVFAWMLMIGLMVFGWIGFSRMGISQLPDVDFPVVNVSITWENAAPEVMETQVADIIEDAVMSVEGVRDIYSNSTLGATNLTIEFSLSRSIDAAVADVQSHIAQAQRNLPAQIDPPIIQKVNPEDQPIMWLALRAKPGSKTTLQDICRYVNEHLRDELAMTPGVGDIRIGGFAEPNLRIWLDADKMAEREITVEDVLGAINAEHADVPAGYIDAADKEFNVRVYGEAASPEDFSKLIIPTRVRGGSIYRKIRFSDVATIEDGLNDVRRVSRYRGERAVGLGVIKQRGTNAVAVGDAVQQRIKELNSSMPSGLEIRKVFDTTRFIKNSVRELDSELVRSVLLTSLVCLFFLGSWSATFNVLLAIPTSILGTFIVLYFCGFTINSFTMLGLALVIGIIVDDAIMVLENIARYREQGLTKVRAALVGAREITSAAVAASMAILAIFLPVIFMRGIVGKFFFQFGVTISFAVLISLIEALTIAPMRCSQFLKVGADNAVGRFVDRRINGVREGYRRVLGICLLRPKTVLASALALFAGSLSLTRALKKEFIPSQDQSIFMVNVTLPLGVSLDRTDEVFRTQLEPWFAERQELEGFYSNIGGSTGGQVNTGMFMVTMKPIEERPLVDGHRETQAELMQLVRQHFSKVPGIDRVSIMDPSQSGFSARRGYPIQFMVQGPDWGKLADTAYAFRDEMRKTGLMTDVDTDYNPGMPEVQIKPDRAKGAASGITARAIGDTVNAMIGGIKYGKYTARGKRYDVRVRLVDKHRNSPKDFSRIWVRDNYGNVVRLPEVITSEVKPSLPLRQPGPRQIARGGPAEGAGDREEDPARGLPHRDGGQLPALRGVLPEPDLRADPRRLRRLHDPRDPVQQLHPPDHRADGPALQRHGRVGGPVAHAPEPQPLQHDRSDPADGHRQEELDLAGGFHQRAPAPRPRRARGAARRLPDPLAPHPDDVGRDGRGRGARGAVHRRRPRIDGPDGRHRHRRRHRLDLPDPHRHPVLLRGHERVREPQARRRAARSPHRPG